MIQKRIFLGSFIKQPLLNKLLTETRIALSPTGNFKWTRTPENLHLTWHFFGGMQMSKIKELKLVLQPFLTEEILPRIDITGLKYFKRKGQPAILYAEVQSTLQLQEYYKKLQRILFENGFISQINDRFVPHITLARIKKVNKHFYEQMKAFEKISENIYQNNLELTIIESILEPQGALYRPLLLDSN